MDTTPAIVDAPATAAAAAGAGAGAGAAAVPDVPAPAAAVDPTAAYVPTEEEREFVDHFSSMPFPLFKRVMLFV